MPKPYTELYGKLYSNYTTQDRPDPNGPARIDHYPESIQRQLKRICMVPEDIETHGAYCMRCKEYVTARHPELA